jgi:acetyl-CoA C-acetyltransferase
MIHDGLWDIVNDFHMGISNELCSERTARRAEKTRTAMPPNPIGGPGGHRQRPFKDEIVPVDPFPSARGIRSSSTRMSAPGPHPTTRWPK